jgi:undecaprenyl-diphosphatase
VWLCAAAVALGLAAYSTQAGQASWEAEVMRDFQASTPAPMRHLAEFMTALGRSPYYELIALTGALALIAVARRPWLALLLFGATVLRGTSPIMKDIVGRDRPSPEYVTVADILPSQSFPSGHVLGATLVFGALIYAVEVSVPHRGLRRACQALLASMILLMGYARVELGEHWPVDVLGGWIIGGLMLAALVWMHRAVERPEPEPVRL